jgi:hypothetical protein
MSGSLFKLYVLQQNQYDLLLGSELEKAWPKLKGVELDKSPVLIITAEDIETYNWSQQKITLTPEATNRLDKVLWGKIAMSKNVFAVTFKGNWLYGGIVTEASSAAWVSYPVIYPDVSGPQTILYLRPLTAPVLIKNYEEFDPSVKEIIEIQPVHDFFSELGKLIEN